MILLFCGPGASIDFDCCAILSWFWCFSMKLIGWFVECEGLQSGQHPSPLRLLIIIICHWLPVLLTCRNIAEREPSHTLTHSSHTHTLIYRMVQWNPNDIFGSRSYFIIQWLTVNSFLFEKKKKKKKNFLYRFSLKSRQNFQQQFIFRFNESNWFIVSWWFNSVHFSALKLFFFFFNFPLHFRLLN